MIKNIISNTSYFDRVLNSHRPLSVEGRIVECPPQRSGVEDEQSSDGTGIKPRKCKKRIRKKLDD